MRRLALVILLLLASPAWANDASPAPTTEDLQKQVDFLNAALATVRTQRDQVSAALQDALANAAGLKAQADAAAKRAVPTEAKP